MVQSIPLTCDIPASAIVDHGGLPVTVAVLCHAGQRRILVCRDRNWVSHIAMYFEKGIDPQNIWWLVDRIDICAAAEVGPALAEEMSAQLLRRLQRLLPHRSVVDRLFVCHRERFLSYAVRLPRMAAAAASALDEEYLEKSALLRYYHYNTNLSRGMRPGDVIDEQRASEAVIVASQRLAGDADRAPLPLPPLDCAGVIDSSIFRMFTRRRSSRDYRCREISIQELATLLGLGGGLRESRINNRGERVNFFHYPIGGGIKSTSIFCYCTRVTGMATGVYFYDAVTHSLQPVNMQATIDDLVKTSAYGDALARSAVVLFIVADFYAKTLKYLDRAYRVLVAEAGHLSQNLHLAATAMRMKSCVLMGFDDDALNKLLGLTSGQSAVVSLLTVGK